MSNVTAIRFLAEYPMMGDMEGIEWMNLVLGVAKEAGAISDFKPLASLPGIYGIKMCVFTFDVPVERIQDTPMDRDRDVAKAWATDLANEMVGDSDAEVRWVSTVES